MKNEPMMNFTNQTMWTGDNLPILRGINSDSIDLIYLDPPFNSNANYAAPIGSQAAGAEFKDTWSLSDIEVEWIDLIKAKHPALYRVILAAMTDSDKGYLVYMAPRLLEMHRILKDTGSIYLHCDPTMSHYLKLVMDAIFSKNKFYTEITWRRTNARSDKTFGSTSDIILYYGAPPKNAIKSSLDTGYVERMYRHKDKLGRYNRYGDLTGAGETGGESGQSWRGVSPEEGRHWSVPKSGRYAVWIDREVIPGYLGIRSVHARLNALNDAGLIYWPAKGTMPKLKRYLIESSGQVIGNVWTDIPRIIGPSKERLGYPTQKPIALLKRIIEASSNPGDIVLDPFAGCATTCIAAEELERQWIGIDISKTAVKLVNRRLKEHLGLFYECISRPDLPVRSDLGKLPAPSTHKKALYGEQGGHCNGCDEHFQLRNLEVDHIIARKVGGTDHPENLQLLCGSCNKIKGARGMEYLKAKLAL